jgi:DNA repair protein RadC
MKQTRLRLVERTNRFAGIKPADLTETEAESVMDLALRILAARHKKGQTLQNPDQTQAYLRLHLAERPNEVFVCLFLDNKHRVIALEELFQGTIDGASVHPREVVRRAIQVNAAALIVAHNHPYVDFGVSTRPACHPRDVQFRLETSFGLTLRRSSASSRSRRSNSARVSCHAAK